MRLPFIAPSNSPSGHRELRVPDASCGHAADAGRIFDALHYALIATPGTGAKFRRANDDLE
jgi:hypothetical protein